jgi:hypothetical protein
MKTIDEKSKAIADFMAVRKNEDGTYEFPEFGFLRVNGQFMTSFFPERLKYHCSFDWLMPAIKKCRRVSKESENGLFDKDTDNLKAQLMYEEIEECLLDLHELATFNAVYSMVEWITKKQQV